MHMCVSVCRFEMPYHIWCGGCEAMIAKGVRFNAEKKQVGNYFSTKVCPLPPLLTCTERCRPLYACVYACMRVCVCLRGASVLLNTRTLLQIWSFKMKAACCQHEIEIQTDPKACTYVVVGN